MLMMCSDADSKPCPLHMTICVMHMPLSLRVDAFSLLTSSERETRCWNVHSIFQNKLDYRRVHACCVPKNMDDHEACLMGL